MIYIHDISRLIKNHLIYILVGHNPYIPPVVDGDIDTRLLQNPRDVHTHGTTVHGAV